MNHQGQDIQFAIIGAPKTGTTSLANWLAGHPGIWVPTDMNADFPLDMKEPRYFCFDADRYRQIRTLEDYRALFAEGHRRGLLCGEASASYLFSPVALPHLMIDNPDCRIIVMVRNPLELVVSLHAQKLASEEENEKDFETAWRLSPARAEERMVSALCDAPRYLDYQAIGRLGEQLARAMLHVPREQLHVIVHDDLRADPGAVYRATLAFLGLENDGRSDFPVYNARRRNRLPLAIRILKTPPVRAIKRSLKDWAPRASHVVGSRFYRAISAPAEHLELRPELRAELVEFYKDDVALLGRLLKRDLSHWLA
jgi:hypothetical protein